MVYSSLQCTFSMVNGFFFRSCSGAGESCVIVRRPLFERCSINHKLPHYIVPGMNFILYPVKAHLVVCIIASSINNGPEYTGIPFSCLLVDQWLECCCRPPPQPGKQHLTARYEIFSQVNCTYCVWCCCGRDCTD